MKPKRKYQLLLGLLILSNIPSFAQLDTSINGTKYEAVSRYSNGKVKQVGQFGVNCIGDKHCKHGTFISYNKNGYEIRRKIYFFDQRHNRKIFGLKQGWWGFYGLNEKYILDIKKKTSIVDPCF